ncbi:hypothetical protein RBSH_00147 [Rhodopirellula baltica SH28]|uniref:Uncharacterized protein n=3 Tax=Rhodopirellula baltica TaxID=265606 RepID=F2ALV9_RHOBT|nr:hypothetical protein RBWH47_04760 [Rhodopirellula baltica WH47]EKK04532.1 hypothetical protein RBSH_00147 [Rhodopirellula baltica SH28]ELP30650.1 hypothetical protein RBSWK_05379 [Rhodopirellula baltica SWK14]
MVPPFFSIRLTAKTLECADLVAKSHHLQRFTEREAASGFW